MYANGAEKHVRCTESPAFCFFQNKSCRIIRFSAVNRTLQDFSSHFEFHLHIRFTVKEVEANSSYLSTICILSIHIRAIWQAKALDSPSASLQAGLAVISILARGNDYLPGVGQLSLTSTQSRAGVWTEYLKLKQQPEWKDRYTL